MFKEDSKRVLTLTYQDYYDKVLAGWIGKSLGGIVGAPYENHKQFNKVTPETLWPTILYPNDDLDIQVVWLEALQELGLYLTSVDLAKFWQDRCFYTCCEYGIFLHNYQRGIEPPLSGTWNNPFSLPPRAARFAAKFGVSSVRGTRGWPPNMPRLTDVWITVM